MMQDGERLIGVVFIFVVGVLVGMSIQGWRERHSHESVQDRERQLTNEAIERADRGISYIRFLSRGDWLGPPSFSLGLRGNDNVCFNHPQSA